MRGLARPVRGKLGTVVAIRCYCREPELAVYFVQFGGATYAVMRHELEEKETSHETAQHPQARKARREALVR